jgi:hypothetical protein
VSSPKTRKSAVNHAEIIGVIPDCTAYVACNLADKAVVQLSLKGEKFERGDRSSRAKLPNPMAIRMLSDATAAIVGAGFLRPNSMGSQDLIARERFSSSFGMEVATNIAAREDGTRGAWDGGGSWMSPATGARSRGENQRWLGSSYLDFNPLRRDSDHGLIAEAASRAVDRSARYGAKRRPEGRSRVT